jgi:hypothetical protein
VSYALYHHDGTDRWHGNPFLLKALNDAGGDSGGAASERIPYTTKSGVTRMATRAQVSNWTRGSR